MSEKIEDIARAMVLPGQGILAADESTGTIQKRFDSIGVENTETNRRDYREMLFRSDDAMNNNIAGVIQFEETLFQKAADGTPFVDLIRKAGAVPGIKVDKGAQPLAGHPGETVTAGLDGLPERLAQYHEAGARFAKWRAVISITDALPTRGGILANAHALARYAADCQRAGIVPIVEPEVQMDADPADHTIERCHEVTAEVLRVVFEQLSALNVKLEGMILKPNMVVPGSRAQKQATPEEVAHHTVAVLKRTVPSAVPGIAFLSGGQSDEEATANLAAMNANYDLPWALTYSYGRALQAACLSAWSGLPENVPAAQKAFTHRARMNGLAAKGEWTAEAERG
ncbi:class I fructose-bisphosphate aldolase [Ahrensia sp. R2A130]|uniref:class I fructose-bisphosphate aldolase n=1 Tax=Ahrensia sp. R2A130 TaxID=744979 RepID=UPI0001E0B52D|nr:class I fructose-bisphosphate aldolase [Ahrensia sp. R2A130]EFL87793.1 fructose-bisphosphate aldolase class-I [Ahrensia sp. R2A130]